MNANILLEALDIALISFDKQGNTSYISPECYKFWQLKTTHNLANITIFFEELREKDLLPIILDFRQYCAKLQQLAISSNNASISNEYLLHDRYIYEIQIVHPDGLMIYWKDISYDKHIKYQLNHYKNIYNKIIEKSKAPILIVSSSGIVVNYNNSFDKYFNLAGNLLQKQHTHIKDFLFYNELISPNTEDIHNLLTLIIKNKSFEYQITHQNYHLNIFAIALGNGDLLVNFEQQHNQQANLALQEKTIESLNNLIHKFTLELNFIVKNPLDEAIALNNMLQNGYAGELNNRQRKYLETILDNLEHIKNNLEYKTDLITWENINNPKTMKQEEINFDIIISKSLYNLKQLIEKKHLNIKVKNYIEDKTFISNYQLLQKLLHLILHNIFTENQENSSINIFIQQSNYTNNIEIIIEDYLKQNLLNDTNALQYDILLIKQITTVLNYKINSNYHMQKSRKITITTT